MIHNLRISVSLLMHIPLLIETFCNQVNVCSCLLLLCVPSMHNILSREIRL